MVPGRSCHAAASSWALADMAATHGLLIACFRCLCSLQLCRVKSHYVIPSVSFLTGARKAAAMASYREHVARIPCKVGSAPPSRLALWPVLVLCGRAAGAARALTFFKFHRVLSLGSSRVCLPTVCAPFFAHVCAPSLTGDCSTTRPMGCARLACTAFTFTKQRRRSRRGAVPVGAVVPAAGSVAAGGLGVAVVPMVMWSARQAWMLTSMLTRAPILALSLSQRMMRPRMITSTSRGLRWKRSWSCSTFLPQGAACPVATSSVAAGSFLFSWWKIRMHSIGIKNTVYQVCKRSPLPVALCRSAHGVEHVW